VGHDCVRANTGAVSYLHRADYARSAIDRYVVANRGVLKIVIRHDIGVLVQGEVAAYIHPAPYARRSGVHQQQSRTDLGFPGEARAAQPFNDFPCEIAEAQERGLLQKHQLRDETPALQFGEATLMDPISEAVLRNRPPLPAQDGVE